MNMFFIVELLLCLLELVVQRGKTEGGARRAKVNLRWYVPYLLEPVWFCFMFRKLHALGLSPSLANPYLPGMSPPGMVSW